VAATCRLRSIRCQPCRVRPEVFERLGTGYTCTPKLLQTECIGKSTVIGRLLARRAGIDLDVLLTGSAASSAFISRDLGVLLAGNYLTSGPWPATGQPAGNSWP
jgi:hypothetical protein